MRAMRLLGLAAAALSLTPSLALAAPPAPMGPAAPAADTIAEPVVHDIRAEIPLVGLTSSAFGATKRSAGAAGFAGVLGGGSAAADSTQLGGGGRLWGSPIDRLTLIVEVNRRFGGEAAPSATAQVRIAGDHARGWAVGASLGYKAEGFAELEGEIEGALLLSFEKRGFHVDGNVVVGGGIEEKEVDGEVKLRLGYDVTKWMRVGADSRFRYRLAGDFSLPGKRAGDFLAGPEIVFGYKYFFAALSGGPATYKIVEGIGWTATTTIGGAYFW
jgi:hypothetical protein